MIAKPQNTWAIRFGYGESNIFPSPWTLNEIHLRSALGRANVFYDAVHLHAWVEHQAHPLTTHCNTLKHTATNRNIDICGTPSAPTRCLEFAWVVCGSSLFVCCMSSWGFVYVRACTRACVCGMIWRDGVWRGESSVCRWMGAMSPSLCPYIHAPTHTRTHKALFMTIHAHICTYT